MKRYSFNGFLPATFAGLFWLRVISAGVNHRQFACQLIPSPAKLLSQLVVIGKAWPVSSGLTTMIISPTAWDHFA
ncbi:MAG: hypothetical protein EBU63_05210 [Alphaproteobacteria bacterium]|nr:hypothetical protein [Alphaproteobacteria bacterium]